MTRIRCMALVSAATLIGGVAFAEPLRYDEAVDGDFVYLGADRTEILPLAFGNNIIRGSVRYELVGGVVEEDSDTFGFTVPMNGSVQRIRLSYGPYPHLLGRMVTLWDRSTGKMVGYYSIWMNYGTPTDTPNPAEPFADVRLEPGRSYSIVFSGGVWQYPGGAMPYEWSILLTGRPADR